MTSRFTFNLFLALGQSLVRPCRMYKSLGSDPSSEPTVIGCYGNSLLKKYASVSDLKDRMSRVEEWLRQVEGKDNEKSVRKEARKLS